MAKEHDSDDIIEDVAEAGPSTSELSFQIESLKEDLAAITETLTAMGRAKSMSLVEAAKDEAYLLRLRGEEKVAQLQDRASVMTSQAQQMVRENPSTALGVAAGAGFLLGIIMSRR